MDLDRFWELVEESRERGAGDLHEQAAALRNLLSALPVEQVRSFHAHLLAAHKAIYTWPHLAAGELALDWLSDDAFTDFRSWVISTGRKNYERFRADPDSLAEFEEAPWEAELFGAAATRVYAEKTVRDLADIDFPVEPVEQLPPLEPGEAPTGEEPGWRDRSDLRRRLPEERARTSPQEALTVSGGWLSRKDKPSDMETNPLMPEDVAAAFDFQESPDWQAYYSTEAREPVKGYLHIDDVPARKLRILRASDSQGYVIELTVPAEEIHRSVQSQSSREVYRRLVRDIWEIAAKQLRWGPLPPMPPYHTPWY